jgi:hypothetical protein
LPADPRLTAAGPTSTLELELELEVEVDVEVEVELVSLDELLDIDCDVEIDADELLVLDCDWMELDADAVDDFKAVEIDEVDRGVEADEIDVVEPDLA